MTESMVFDKNEAKSRGNRLIECFKSIGMDRQEAAFACGLSYNNFGRYLRGEIYISDTKAIEFASYLNREKKLIDDYAILPEYITGKTAYMTKKDERRAIQAAVDSDIEGSSKAFTYLLSLLGIEVRGYYVAGMPQDGPEIYPVYLGEYNTVYRYIPINGNNELINFYDLGISPYYEFKFSTNDENSIVVLSSVEYDLLIEEIKEFAQRRMRSIQTIHNNLSRISKKMIEHVAVPIDAEIIQRLKEMASVRKAEINGKEDPDNGKH